MTGIITKLECSWRCRKCGGQIGIVARQKIAERSQNLQVLVLGSGDVELAGLGRVRCPICHKWQTWEPGRVVLEKLITATGRSVPTD